MINMTFFAVLSLSFLSLCVYTAVLYVKAAHSYIIDGADLRVCTMSQCIVFLILMNIEMFSFWVRKNIMPVDIYLFKTYISFMFYFISASRLLGYKSLFFPKKLKNTSYLIITLGFYVSTTTELFFLTKLDIPVDLTQRMDCVSSIIKSGCANNTHLILHSIPAFYSLICYLFIVLFDAFEKRGSKALFIDTVTDLPIMFYVILSLSTRVNFVSNVLSIFIFIIPLFAIMFEIKSIMYYCSKERNNTDYLRNLIRRSYKLPGAKRLYNARLISKFIKQNPSLGYLLPNDSKYEDFLRLVDSFSKEVNN